MKCRAKKKQPTKELQGRRPQYSSKHSSSSTYTGASPKICPLSVSVPQADLPFSSRHAGYLPAKHTGHDWNHGLTQARRWQTELFIQPKYQTKMSSVNWLLCHYPVKGKNSHQETLISHLSKVTSVPTANNAILPGWVTSTAQNNFVYF